MYISYNRKDLDLPGFSIGRYPFGHYPFTPSKSPISRKPRELSGFGQIPSPGITDYLTTTNIVLFAMLIVAGYLLKKKYQK